MDFTAALCCLFWSPWLVPSCPIPCHWYSVRVCGSLQGEKEVLGAQGEIASLGWLFTLKPGREAKCHGENTKVWDFIMYNWITYSSPNE